MENMFRQIIWMLTHFFLWVGDALFDVMTLIAEMNIFQFNEINWYYSLAGLSGIIIVYKLFAIWLEEQVNEDNRPMMYKMTVMDMMTRLLAVVLCLTMLPTACDYFCKASIVVISNTGALLSDTPTTLEVVPSEIITRDMREILDLGPLETYDAIDSKKLKSKVNGDYKLSTDNLIFVFLVSVCSGIAFFLIGIQFSQRFLSLMFTVIIAWYPITSIVNGESQTFKQWIKIFLSNIIGNIGQYIFVLLVFSVASSSVVTESFGHNIFIRAIFFLGCLLACLNGPSQIAQLIGGDSFGAATSMQGMETLARLGGMAKTAGGLGLLAAKKAGSVGGNMASMGLGGAAAIGAGVNAAKDAISAGAGIAGGMAAGASAFTGSVGDSLKGTMNRSYEDDFGKTRLSPNGGFNGGSDMPGTSSASTMSGSQGSMNASVVDSSSGPQSPSNAMLGSSMENGANISSGSANIPNNKKFARAVRAGFANNASRNFAFRTARKISKDPFIQGFKNTMSPTPPTAVNNSVPNSSLTNNFKSYR